MDEMFIFLNGKYRFSGVYYKQLPVSFFSKLISCDKRQKSSYTFVIELVNVVKTLKYRS